MARNNESATVKMYRMRLLNVLLKEDIQQMMAELNIAKRGDHLDSKFHLVNNWNIEIENYIFIIIKLRLNNGIRSE